jgi:hypothetical protein
MTGMNAGDTKQIIPTVPPTRIAHENNWFTVRGSVESRLSWSLEKRLSTRPTGVESKKCMGAVMTAASMRL